MVAYAPDGTEFVYNLGDMAWIVASMALVWIMIPGVGLFYSGLLRRKNALSMIWTSLASIAVVSFQVCSLRYYVNDLLTDTLEKWFFWGYSLAFSETGNAFIGDLSESDFLIRRHVPKCIYHWILEYFGLKGVLDQPSIGSSRIPALLFCIYQLMFAAITCALFPLSNLAP